MKQIALHAMCFFLCCVVAHAIDMNRAGTMYAPYIEWSVCIRVTREIRLI